MDFMINLYIKLMLSEKGKMMNMNSWTFIYLLSNIYIYIYIQ